MTKIRDREKPPGFLSFTSMHSMFFAWCDRNDLGTDLASRKVMDGASIFDAVQSSPQFWSREKFRKEYAKTSDWRYLVGSYSSPRPFGMGGAYDQPWFEPANFLYMFTIGFVIGTLLLWGGVLFTFGGWTLLVAVLGGVLVRRWFVWKPMADTWNGKNS